MTKTRNTLLNTQLHSPVTFLGAPRNTIPNQEIPPLPTSRVTTGSQRVSLSATPVQKAPLHTTQGQVLTKQSLQRVGLQKQSVGVQALSMTREDNESSGDKLPGHSSPFVTLSATSLLVSKLKPLKNATAPSRVSRETAARPKQNITARPQVSNISMPLVAERRLPLMGQRTELHPVFAMQRPVARRRFRLKRK